MRQVGGCLSDLKFWEIDVLQRSDRTSELLKIIIWILVVDSGGVRIKSLKSQWLVGQSCAAKV